MSAAKVMVTGGCGFIGSALVRLALARGDDVIVVDDLRLGRPENLLLDPADRPEIAAVDLEDADATRRLIESHRPTTILHLAAMHFIPDCERNPRAAVGVNVSGTQSLLDAARDVEELEGIVVASSGAVYAPGSGPHREDEPPGPDDVYGSTKLWNEHQSALFQGWRGGAVGVGVARLFNVFGPGETNEHLIPAILRQALAGGVLQLGNLTTRRDYVFVEDAADALLRLADLAGRERDLETVNIGTGVERSGTELIDEVGALLDRDLTVEPDPARARRSDRPHLLSDPARARELLGWEPRNGLRGGLEAALERPLAQPEG
jgi:UDP-glucose 4-epimerase